MATTNPAPLSGQINQPQSLLLTFAEIGLGLIAQIAGGGMATLATIAADLAPIVQQAVTEVRQPSLSGITGILDSAATVLEKDATGAVAADAKVADALLKMVQAASQAVQAQAGLPIDPSQVPQLPVFNPTPSE